MNFDNLIEEWNAAGKPGGIPDVSVVRTVAPGEDIQAAIDAVHAAGGGAVLLEEGTHRVSQSINLKSNVVLRGEDRDKTVIESTIRSNDGDSTIEMDNVTNGGVENLTLEYVVPGYTPDPHAYTNTPGGNDDNIDTGHIYLTSSTKHSWVKDVTALNAGSDPIVVDGHYNTLSGNYVEGAYMKGGGGNGYYRVRGDHNLFENETVIDIRHFAIMDTADHNVIVDSYFETDINFHSGDSGSNLVENNTLKLKAGHYWFPFAIGHADWGHKPPGPNNVIVNNDVYHEKEWFSLDMEEDVIYSYFGFNSEGGTRQRPTETDWELPPGGEFYTANNDNSSAASIPEPAASQNAPEQKVIEEAEPEVEEPAAEPSPTVTFQATKKAAATIVETTPEPVVAAQPEPEVEEVPEPEINNGPALAPNYGEVAQSQATDTSDDAAPSPSNEGPAVSSANVSLAATLASVFSGSVPMMGAALGSFVLTRDDDASSDDDASGFLSANAAMDDIVPVARSVDRAFEDSQWHNNTADTDWMAF